MHQNKQPLSNENIYFRPASCLATANSLSKNAAKLSWLRKSCDFTLSSTFLDDLEFCDSLY